MLQTEQRKHSDPSAKLYSETWSLHRQISDNGKQVYRGQGKRSILNRRGRSTAKAPFTQDAESAALWNPFISMACAARGRWVAVPNKAHAQRTSCELARAPRSKFKIVQLLPLWRFPARPIEMSKTSAEIKMDEQLILCVSELRLLRSGQHSANRLVSEGLRWTQRPAQRMPRPVWKGFNNIQRALTKEVIRKHEQ